MAALIAFATANPETALQVALLGLIWLVGAAMVVCAWLHFTAADRRRNRSNRRRDNRRAGRMAAFRRRVRSA
ncbi:MAG: hypothetical protein EOR22_06330 [Mesorhizobium sp.]|nr:MAG: hypothetical protein EOR22_06330 [Mesorhizobium sp.]